MVSPHLAWSPPPSGELKLNSDVSVRKGFNHIGVGVVIRNDCGQMVMALTKVVLDIFSAKVGELLALRDGLLSAKNLGLVVNWVEVDVVNVDSGLADAPSLPHHSLSLSTLSQPSPSDRATLNQLIGC
ncbi:hypothetical protein LWI28_015762 [Acer negundo]|uniref:RNase H type-1 domain-containing protein n=1 Tax=Acer negundo TaxID=4023 RepID=A0AAD5J6A0_ACENE|nr:hypothetical protein LWI28_015762 [Acer negundo]